MRKWLTWLDFLRNMGPVYVLYRTGYELAKKTGILAFRFPTRPELRNFTTLSEWRQRGGNFFFRDKESLPACSYTPPSIPAPDIPSGGDWLTHPHTGYRYSRAIHWTKIPDFSAEAGDIKDIWELSRFTFLYDLIRRDFHFGENGAEASFRAMEDWISHNPVNCGPNWKCSQEISVRILNWTFALQYFKNSPHLTESRLTAFLNSIRQQARHVRDNILFSRIAVRNNHALAETLCLYITGVMYPFFPESREWEKQGRRWFGEEVAYQINREGAFVQHSMNYHRAAIQLLSWAIAIARLNGHRWEPVVCSRASATLAFLTSFQDRATGWLPNYGNNDGALFFPLTSGHFRDFRPQLGTLAALLGENAGYPPGCWQEESFWLSTPPPPSYRKPEENTGCFSFPESGYFAARNGGRLLFIRCAAYRTRPSQSDNLHLDLWEDGENLLFDAGTYRYNTEEKYKAYYAGTAAHNTVALGRYDQMGRGPRFIWSHWIKKASGKWTVTGDRVIFDGWFYGYRHLVPAGILHRRTITTGRELDEFLVEDTFAGKPDGLEMRQLWHASPRFHSVFSLSACDENGNEILPCYTGGWYSERYGEKEPVRYLEFVSAGNAIAASIRRKT